MTSYDHDNPRLAETYHRISEPQLEGGKRLVEKLGIERGGGSRPISSLALRRSLIWENTSLICLSWSNTLDDAPLRAFLLPGGK